MINSINEYLAALKTELSGQDPATVQDAQSDAEEYLSIALETSKKTRPGLSETEALAEIIKNYGTPAEVAAAYRITPAVPEPPRAVPVKRRNPLASFFGILGQGRAWTSMLYMFLSLGTGIAYFTWVVTGLSLSAGLAVLIIGVPFFALFVLSVRGMAWLEGRIVEGLLGERMPRRARFSDTRKGLWPRFKALFTDRYTWFSMIYMILMLPLGITYFTVFVTLLAVSAAFVAQPVAQAFGWSLINIGDASLFGWNPYMLSVWLLPILFVGGIILFFATFHLAKLAGKWQASLAKSMLVGG
jgi:Putative sensor